MTEKCFSPPSQWWDWLAAGGCNYSISIFLLLRPGETQEADCLSNLVLKHGNSSYQKPLFNSFLLSNA